MLTAVFSMRWVRGFGDQILIALKNDDPEIRYEAVNAAGSWELDAAWSDIVELVNDPHSPKPLVLAAIGAVGSIRPAEAREILVDLADSDDEESLRPSTRPWRRLKYLQTRKTTKRIRGSIERQHAFTNRE